MVCHILYLCSSQLGVSPGIDVCVLVIIRLEAIVPVMVILAVDYQMLHHSHKTIQMSTSVLDITSVPYNSCTGCIVNNEILAGVKFGKSANKFV